MATKNIEINLKIRGDSFQRGMAKGRYELSAAKAQWQQLENQSNRSMKKMAGGVGTMNNEMAKMQKNSAKFFTQTFGKGAQDGLQALKDMARWTTRLATIGGGAMFAKSAYDWLKVSRQSAEIQTKLGSLDYSKEKDPVKKQEKKLAAAAEMKSYRDFAYNTAKETGRDPSEILDSIKESAASGVTKKEGMQTLAKFSAMAATTDSSTNVGELTKGAILLLGEKVNDSKQVEQFFDRLLTSQDLGRGNIGENINALSTAQSSFKDISSIGADRIPDLLGTFTTLTRSMDPAEAATSIGRMVDQFKSIGIDSGANKVLKKSGVNIYDEKGAMNGTDKIVAGFQKAFKGKSEKQIKTFLDDIGLSQIRAERGLVNLLGATDTLHDNIEEIQNASGKTQAVFEIMANSTANKFDRMTMMAKVFGLQFQEAFDPLYGGIGDLFLGKADQVDPKAIGNTVRENLKGIGMGDGLSNILGNVSEGTMLRLKIAATNPDGMIDMVKELAVKGVVGVVSLKVLAGIVGGAANVAGGALMTGAGNAVGGMVAGGGLVTGAVMAAPLAALGFAIWAVADAAEGATGPVDFLGQLFNNFGQLIKSPADFLLKGIGDMTGNQKIKDYYDPKGAFQRNAVRESTTPEKLAQYERGQYTPEQAAREAYQNANGGVTAGPLSPNQQGLVDGLAQQIRAEIASVKSSPLAGSLGVPFTPQTPGLPQPNLSSFGPQPAQQAIQAPAAPTTPLPIDTSGLASSGLATSSDVQSINTGLGPLAGIQQNTANTLTNAQYMAGASMIASAVKAMSININVAAAAAGSPTPAKGG